MSDLHTLGQRIRHYRVAGGKTLDELGTLVGIAGSQLSLMENGKREPRLSLLTRIAETLGIQVADLLSEEAGFVTGAELIVDGGMTRKMIYAE